MSRLHRRLTLEPLECRRPFAVDATLSLGIPTLEGSIAKLPVSLEFTATAGEQLSYFSLDVAPSSSSLIGPGPDFSAFLFTKATPLLDDWSQIGFFNDPGFESTVEYDDSLVAPLPTGTYQLGILSVDLNAAHPPFGNVFTVAIHGSGTVIGVTDPSAGFEFKTVQFDPASRDVVIASIDGATNVAEGATYTLTIQQAVDLGQNAGVNFAIDWGDGNQETITVANLPANGEVEHVFADGPATRTILVEIVEQGGAPSHRWNA